MTRWTAGELLEGARAEFAPDPAANRAVPLIERGEAAPELLRALALEERAVVAADRRAFLRLAERAAGMPRCAAYYAELARGEEVAAARLEDFARAVGAVGQDGRNGTGGGASGNGTGGEIGTAGGNGTGSEAGGNGTGSEAGGNGTGGGVGTVGESGTGGEAGGNGGNGSGGGAGTGSEAGENGTGGEIGTAGGSGTGSGAGTVGGIGQNGGNGEGRGLGEARDGREGGGVGAGAGAGGGRVDRTGGGAGGGYALRPGCQAYPAFVAWLALNAAPAGTVLALAANFSAWGGYCGRIATGLREHYGLDDRACAFFDLFAAPSPEHEETVLAAVQEWAEAGRIDEAAVRRHGRLLRAYEAGFWDALVDG
ncbi:hypothetical protein [Streptomyces sp. NPDC002640]